MAGGVPPPSRGCRAFVAEGGVRRYRLFGELSIVVVQVKLVRLGIVGDQEIGPAVVIVVKPGDAKSFGGRVVEAGFLRHIFKLAIAKVVPEARGGPFIRLMCAL